jgi:hypothetical protein
MGKIGRSAVRALIAIIVCLLVIAFVLAWHRGRRASRCYASVQIGASRAAVNDSLIIHDIWCETLLQDPHDYRPEMSCKFSDSWFTYVFFIDPKTDSLSKKAKGWQPKIFRRAVFNSEVR